MVLLLTNLSTVQAVQDYGVSKGNEELLLKGFESIAEQKFDVALEQMKQLVDIRDGNRIAPIMKPMIAGLSEQDFKDLAAYFESLKPSRLADK